MNQSRTRQLQRKGRFLSPEYAELYCRIFEAWKADPTLSLRLLASRLESSVSNIWKCLQTIQSLSDTPDTELFRLQAGTRHMVPTTHGETFLPLAKRFADAARVATMWTSPNAPEELYVEVAATNTVLVNLLSWALSDQLRSDQSAVIPTFREMDWHDMLPAVANGTVAFAVGPMVPRLSYPGVDLKPLRLKLDVVCTCSFAHQFATDARSEISARDLNSQNVVLLRRGLDPQIDDALKLAGTLNGAHRFDVSSYAAVLANVLAESGYVGILPGWYHALDEFRKQGRMYYVRVKDMDPIELAFYLPAGKELSAGALNLLQTAERHIERNLKPEQPGQPAYFRPIHWGTTEQFEVPKIVSGQWFEYHVVCRRAGFSAPQWMPGDVTLTTKRTGDIVGEEDDIDGTGVLRRYSLAGKALGRLLYWEAHLVKRRDDKDRLVGTKRREDYFAIFNTVTSDGCLVGTWTGFDDEQRMPLSGPVVLSRRPLKLGALQAIARSTMVRFLENGSTLVEKNN